MKVTLHPHPTIPGLFLTRDGRVFQECSFTVQENGYAVGRIGKERLVRRHTLMAETFVGPRPHGQGVRHLDGDPSNDNPRNLAWGTQKENMADAIRHGTTQRATRKRAKLTEEQVREIKRRPSETTRALGAEFGISPTVITEIRSGRAWRWVK